MWRIVSLRFSVKLDKLFSYSGLAFDSDLSRADSTMASLDQTSCSTVAVGILDQCRAFIRKCLKTAEIDAARSQIRARACIRLATSILEFMYDINTLSSTNLNKNDLDVLFSWCQSLASVKSNGLLDYLFNCFSFFNLSLSCSSFTSLLDDILFVKALLRYFIFVTWHKNSSAALMKYVFSHMSLVCMSSDADVSE